MKKFWQLIIDLVSLPHELCHYFAAWLVGVDVVLKRDKIGIPQTVGTAQFCFIALAPFFLGIPPLIYGIWFAFTSVVDKDSAQVALLWIGFSLAWLSTSYYDLIDTWQQLKNRRSA